MKEKFYLIGILMVVGMSIESKAQLSYNKRALGSIGNAPKTGDFLNSASLDNVDMTTGTLKIGIPLYEIKVNDIVVPITLNYSATGLKVGQEASAVGMGWELSAGGKIVRNIQGKDDLGSEGILLYPLPNVANLDPHSNSTHRSVIGEILDGKKDSGWDTYNYSLPNGMGGTYVKNGLTFPYDPLITIVHPGLIKTTDGLQYNFTTGEHKKTTRRIDFMRNTATPTRVTLGQEWNQEPGVESRDWDLSTIVSSKFKDTVFFAYETMGSQNPKLVPKTRISTTESLPLYRETRAASPVHGGMTPHTDDQFYLIQDPMISQSKVETLMHTRLSTINFPNGSVIFEYQSADIAGQDVLTSIRINQKINGVTTLIKRYGFEYDVADQNYGHYLLAVHVYDKTDTWQSAWDFTYEGKLPVVANTGSKAQDRWGFYNGQTGNLTMLDNPDGVLALRTRAHYPITNTPYTSSKSIRYSRPDALGHYGLHSAVVDPITGVIICTIPFADRSYSFANAVKGTLKKVITPTGGLYEYEYEPHQMYFIERPDLSSNIARIESGGGIRIKSITKKLDHDDLYSGLTDIEKNFKKKYVYGMGTYATPGSVAETNGYGMVTTPGVVLRNQSMYYNGLAGNPVGRNNIMLLSHPVNNLVQHGGSYGAYQSVTEFLMKDALSDSYGKTVYYSNLLSPGDAPDAKWDPFGATLENPGLPFMEITPGVSRDFGVGVAGIKKYLYTAPYYNTVEDTKYTFKSFDAPQNSTNKLVNFYGTLTGQMSGPYHISGGTTLRDNPYGENRGGTIIYLYNQMNDTGNGRMDYITGTNVVFDDLTENYNGKYHTVLLDLNTLSNVVKKETEQHKVYDDYAYSSITNDTKFYYDNLAHLLPSRITTKNTKGDSTITRLKYAQDYSGSLNAAIDFMKSDKIGLDEVVEQFSTFKLGSTEYVRDGLVNTFKVQFGSLLNDKTYKMKVGSNPTYAGNYFSVGSHLNTSLFTPEVSYEYYNKGQVHQYKDLGGPGNVVFWGYKNQYPVAKVNNAELVDGYQSAYLSAEVAYSSFEHSDVSNWTYSGTPIADASSPSGKLAYSLSSGAITKSTYTPSTKKYVISYWYKSGASVSVTGGTVGAAVIKKTYGSWTLAEREITSASGTITVSGSGSIDELRFHPADAQMTTYVYDPLVGITCTIDSKGGAQYYEYDNSQRLKNVKDQQGNIVKSYQYIMGALN
ncbi:RHS repeat domain-containing protein [Pedobacter psychroterrae]|uniref:YD repeat-containing protein n=1 Tax=Pedobacter psychroterrae TaxID=2530453 RepID=A0A4V2MKW2_9SPHI|nr:hypothetical protein [Pedobacter psychroterrae]TCC99786.1 hypothetical protein EZ437_16220 [Pedobacter psychroterrae]